MSSNANLPKNINPKHIVYDPIKIINRRRFLNDLSIKFRYDLIYIDEFYKMNNIKFDNNKFAKHKVSGKTNLDKDVLDFNKVIKNMPLSYLVSRAEAIDEKIKKSNVLENLDKLDHTSGNYIRNLRHPRCKDKNNLNFVEKNLNETKNYEISYKNYKIKEKKVTFLKSKENYIEFSNNKHILNGSHSNSCKNTLDNSSLSNKKASKKKLKDVLKNISFDAFKELDKQEYGRLINFPKREFIIKDSLNVEGNENKSKFSSSAKNKFFNLNTSKENNSYPIISTCDTIPNYVDKIYLNTEVIEPLNKLTINTEETNGSILELLNHTKKNLFIDCISNTNGKLNDEKSKLHIHSLINKNSNNYNNKSDLKNINNVSLTKKIIKDKSSNITLKLPKLNNFNDNNSNNNSNINTCNSPRLISSYFTFNNCNNNKSNNQKLIKTKYKNNNDIKHSPNSSFNASFFKSKNKSLSVNKNIGTKYNKDENNETKILNCFNTEINEDQDDFQNLKKFKKPRYLESTKCKLNKNIKSTINQMNNISNKISSIYDKYAKELNLIVPKN